MAAISFSLSVADSLMVLAIWLMLRAIPLPVSRLRVLK